MPCCRLRKNRKRNNQPQNDQTGGTSNIQPDQSQGENTGRTPDAQPGPSGNEHLQAGSGSSVEVGITLPTLS
jgi:hypothetical protein